MNISFLIPTNRDPKYINHVISSINAIPTDYKYEILAYSQQPISGPNVRHIQEVRQEGPIKAFNEMYKLSMGEYVVCLIDDHEPTDPSNFFSFIPFLTSDLFSNRKYKITSFYTHHIPQRVNVVGDNWGCAGIMEDKNTRPHTTIRFPIVHRDTVDNYLQGHIFHPGFVYHAADMWLGFWLGEQTERGIECPATIRQYVSLRNTSFEHQDCRFFHELKNKYWEGYHNYI